MNSDSALFPDLTPSDLNLISERGVLTTYPKNAVLITEGERTDSFYIIHSGKVKVYVSSKGRKEVIVNVQGAGEYFGELAIIDQAPRSASVKTLEESQISVVSKAQFLNCLEAHPRLAFEIIRMLSRRVRALTENIKSLALMDVYGRVARTLLELAVERDDVLIIEDRPSHQNIANMIGASREMVSKIMKELVRGGYVQIKGSKIIIANRLPDAW